MHPPICSRCKKNVAVIFLTRLENGKTVKISARNAKKAKQDLDCYIGEMRLNGKKYESNFISYDDLVEGADISFTMVASEEEARK